MNEKQENVKCYEEEYRKALMEYCTTYNIMGISSLSAGAALSRISLPDIYVPLHLHTLPYRYEKGLASEEKTQSPAVSQVEEEAPGHGSKGIVGEVGSGKTALLQMYTYTFLNMYHQGELPLLVEHFRKELELGTETKLPVFISIPKIEEQVFESFEDILVYIIADFLRTDIIDLEAAREKAIEILQAQEALRIIIDGLDAFWKKENKAQFQRLVKGYMEQHPLTEWYLSSRQEEDMIFCADKLEVCRLGRLETNNWFDDLESGETKARVTDLVYKWLEVVLEADAEKCVKAKAAFSKAIQRNVELASVSNPLELTSVLVHAYHNNYVFPTQMGQMYENMLMLRLNWNRSSGYDVEDILCQLAYIAYQMSLKEYLGKSVTEEQLFQWLLDARTAQTRFYVRECGLEEEELRKFVQYLEKRTNILQYKEDHYKFSFEKDQYYLAAYCIANRLFSRKESKKNFMELLKEVTFSVVIEAFRIKDELRRDILNWLFEELEASDAVGNTRLIEPITILNYLQVFSIQDACIPKEEKLMLWKYFLQGGSGIIRVTSMLSSIQPRFTRFFANCNEAEIEAIWQCTKDFLEGKRKHSRDVRIVKEDLMKIFLSALYLENVSDYFIEQVIEHSPISFLENKLNRDYRRGMVPGRIEKIISRLAQSALNREKEPTTIYYYLQAAFIEDEIGDIVPNAISLLEDEKLSTQVLGIQYIRRVFGNGIFWYKEPSKNNPAKQQVLADCKKLVKHYLRKRIETGYEDYLVRDYVDAFFRLCGNDYGLMELDEPLALYMIDLAEDKMKNKALNIEEQMSFALIDFLARLYFGMFFFKWTKREQFTIKVELFHLYRGGCISPNEKYPTIKREATRSYVKLVEYLKQDMLLLHKRIAKTDTVPRLLNIIYGREAKKYIRKMKV